ncbi:Ribonuclease H-like domain [Cinara cedri]|uniref:Ribonuclease H-like domain n=1 Tax=Cinara cedri TaxID=506608 RepID=A0A5E4MEX1_9HEMI|nr:Ribonuclease H-like domain [Cinara cedri]
MPKRRCVFAPNLKSEFHFLKDADEVGKVFCTIFRVEHLKEFCEYANVEYKNILGSVKTRWLSLLPGITRIIDIYPGLKLYFEEQEKCPTILKSFFNDPISKVWFYFLQSQLKVVCNTVIKIEGDKKSTCKVAEELKILVEKIKNRKNQNFLTSNILSMLNDLKNNNIHIEQVFQSRINEWQKSSAKLEVKWCEIIEYTKAHNIDTTNISAILEYALAMPGTNTAVEKIFSTINVLWTDEKNRFLVETIKSIIDNDVGN